MLISRNRYRSHREDRLLALALATTAGLLNALAFGAFGFFPSHMTGNTSKISAEVGLTHFNDMVFLTSLIIAFVIGATLSRLLVGFGLRRNVRTIFCLLLMAEGLLLLGIAMFELFWFTENNNREILISLGLLMGLHNSTSTQISRGRVRSTHITGTLTDTGIALGALMCASLSQTPTSERQALLSVLVTHLVTIGSFLTGCMAGYLLFTRAGFYAMAALGLFIALIAASNIIRILRFVHRRAI
jgi:uncharacterized membrane protein YoaK (UPF0700 family)